MCSENATDSQARLQARPPEGVHASSDALLERALDYLRPRIAVRPQAAIILGSGLGELSEKLHNAARVNFGDIPGFSTSTADGHRGELMVGMLEDQPVVVMSGRFHRYEGKSCDEIGFPVRVMHALGARVLVASNAAGAVNPRFSVGDIVVIRDHLDWMRGVARFLSTDRTPCDNARRCDEFYDRELADEAIACAMREGFTACSGTYLATLGPTYETRAEYRMMRRVGADVVGMSTVPEVLVAKCLGMRVLALSVVSNVARPDQRIGANHEEVLVAGRAVAVKMEALVRALLRRL